MDPVLWGVEVDNGSAEQRLLLGTVGWARPDWLTGYYPEDLPEEWRLAYYANDCGCSLLDADPLRAVDGLPSTEMLAEVPARLRLFIRAAADPGSTRRALQPFAGRPVVLLVEQRQADLADYPQWEAQGAGEWRDPQSGASLVCWSVETFDLRALRGRAAQLPDDLRALVIGGPGASPARVPELRTLLELLGRG